MQARPLHLAPLSFPSPIDVPPVFRISSRPAVVSRAITISTPNNTRFAEPPVIDVVDDSVAAFWDYQFLFVSQRSETAQPAKLRVVDGAIPADFPAGTYYLAGPGLFADDHGSTVHPLDGHGYLRAFIFDEGNKEVKFMAKYVKTAAQVEEHDPLTDTWRFTHRGPFSVLKGGKKVGNTKVMKNVANTSVLMWGGRLMCLWEGGDPYEIESGTLNTLGMLEVVNGSDSETERESDGVDVDAWDMAATLLKPVLQGVFKMPPKRLLSHYKIDGRRNRLLLMACNTEDMLLPRSNFTFYEFDSNFNALEKQEFSIPDHLMIHDWAFTDTHYLLFCNRIKLDVTGAMAAVFGISPMISALSVNPSKETSPIYLLPRFPNASHGDRDWKVPVEVPSQLWLLHVGNAFEFKDDGGSFNIQVHASACSYKWFNFHKLFGYNWRSGKLDPSTMNTATAESELLPHLVQVSIALDADGNSQRCSVEHLNQGNKASDFPAINPAFSGYKNKYVYAATSSGSRRSLPSFPFDTVMKLDVQNNSTRKWSAGNRRFIGEPVFVPKGDGEDDGFLLVVEYAVYMQRCFLVILNPVRIGEADAVVARLEVPRHLNFPFGFHEHDEASGGIPDDGMRQSEWLIYSSPNAEPRLVGIEYILPESLFFSPPEEGKHLDQS